MRRKYIFIIFCFVSFFAFPAKFSFASGMALSVSSINFSAGTYTPGQIVSVTANVFVDTTQAQGCPTQFLMTGSISPVFNGVNAYIFSSYPAAYQSTSQPFTFTFNVTLPTSLGQKTFSVGSYTVGGGLSTPCSLWVYQAPAINFTIANASAPTVDTPTATSITTTGATLGANVASLGVPDSISERGVCYSTSANPSLINGATCVPATLSQAVPSAYTVSVTGLTPNTTYNYRGYATNSTGTGYSADGTFTTTLANTPPTATIWLPSNGYTTSGKVVFFGTGSDPDVGDTIVAWEWWNGGCGLGMNLSTLSTDTLSFGVGPHTIYFRVKDSKGTWSTCDSRTITITANIPPVANAGPNQIVTLPTSSVTMSGSAIDSDGIIASYAWSKISGPATFSITDFANPNTTITGLVAGTYTFRLTATDDLGATGSANMTVTVNPASCTLGGATVLSGNNITAYQFSLVPAPVTCASVSETRTCNNGTLSGSYANDICSVVTSCTLPWGGTIPSGSSVTAYQVSSSLNCASVSESRTCNNGTLSGSFTKQSCTATKLKYKQF